MTDHPSHDPNDRLDELASAYLDGEATAAEAAEVDRNPQLAARIESLRATAHAVAAPVPSPPAAIRDEAIARAVAAFEPARTVPATVDLAQERTRRRSHRGLWVASVAAALLAVLAGVSLLSGLADGDDDDAVLADTDAERQAEGEEAGGGESLGPPSTLAEAPTADAGGDSLGEFSDVDDLVAAVRAEQATPVPESAPEQSLLVACASQLGPIDHPLAVYPANVDGRPVTAIVYVDGSGDERLVVITPACEVLVDTEP